jgi:virulence factor Mce-like protein
MSAPIRTGRALLLQRLGGIAFLVVIALLVSLTVLLYRKSFTPVVHVTLTTDRVGNQLTSGADVKLRGVVVGEVRSVRSDGDGARLDLALKPSAHVPADVRAQLLPKTLFGEKLVSLSTTSADGPFLKAGDVISQDRSETARETETAVNDLLPLLKALKPEQLSTTLNALSAALRDRGDELGANLARTAAYLKQLNPSLPTLQQDLAGLADFANSTADATPDLLTVLDNLSASSRYLVQEKADLDAFLTSTQGFAATARDIVAENENRFVVLARDSKPVLQLYARYAGSFPCMAAALSALEAPIEDTFGGKQGGLHITVEAIKDNGGYDATMVPRYGDTGGTQCYGLDPKHPVIPATDYYNPYDGYYDGQVVDPYTAKPPCTHNPCAYPPKGGRADDAAVLAVAAGKMGVSPQHVPDVAALLLRPVAQGGTVGLT